MGRLPKPREPNCCDCRRPFGAEVVRSAKCPNRCSRCQRERGRKQAINWYYAHGGKAALLRRERTEKLTPARQEKKEPTYPVPLGTWCLCLPCRVHIERPPQRFDASYLERLIASADDEGKCVFLTPQHAEQIRLALGYIRELESERVSVT